MRKKKTGKLTVKRRVPVEQHLLTVKPRLSNLQKHILVAVLEWPERWKAKGYWLPVPTRSNVALDYAPWGFKKDKRGYWPSVGNKATVSMSRAVKRLKEKGLIIEEKIKPVGYHYDFMALKLTEPGEKKARLLLTSARLNNKETGRKRRAK